MKSKAEIVKKLDELEYEYIRKMNGYHKMTLKHKHALQSMIDILFWVLS